MSTPGRRKALKRLAETKRANKAAYEAGNKTGEIGGEQVTFPTLFKKIGGKPKSWKKGK